MADDSYNDPEEIKKELGLYGQPDVELVQMVWKRHKADWKFQAKWREEAERCYGFRDSHQWSTADEEKLKKESRPIITFNQINVIVAAVLGIEEQQKQETTFLAREKDDSMFSEGSAQWSKWVRDNGEIDVEESSCFEDLITCGMGWAESRMDYEVDLDGKICQDQIDALEMSWDKSAKKRNLKDRRWHTRARLMEPSEVTSMWPDKAEELLASMTDSSAATGDSDKAFAYVNPADRYASGEESKEPKKGVTVLHHQWYQTEDVYRVQTPAGKIIEISPELFEKAKDMLAKQEAKYIKQKKRVYYQAFVGNQTLLEKSKLSVQSNFTLNCVTGKRDKIDNSWYGLVRLMIEPQEWANKFLSQILHIINSNAKGGIMAETDAFADPVRAENDWAKPDAVTLMQPGSLRDGKVLPKPASPYPHGLDKLLSFALRAVRESVGVSLELIGLAEKKQVGMVEESRKRSGFTILATLFGSLGQFRRTNGIVMMELTGKFVSVQRIASVLEKEHQQIAQKIKSMDLKQLDVIVAEAPKSESNKMMAWEFIQSIAPFLVQAGIPVPPEILDYSPLPKPLAEQWKAMIEKGGGEDPEMAAMMQKVQQLMTELAMLKEKAEIRKLDTEADENEADVVLKMANANKARVEANQPQPKQGDAR
ncbi:hypothetical protein KAR91_11775 [Candidatus Pacearchaeota archaeon]|nr:hypothetical protein [Candidatus Pacearchaeota archaeon]